MYVKLIQQKDIFHKKENYLISKSFLNLRPFFYIYYYVNRICLEGGDFPLIITIALFFLSFHVLFQIVLPLCVMFTVQLFKPDRKRIYFNLSHHSDKGGHNYFQVILAFFISDFSHFCPAEQNVLKCDMKNSRICPI